MTSKKSTRSKVQVPKFDAQMLCSCRRQCPKTITIDIQKEIFEQFYAVNTKNKWRHQTLFLRSLISNNPVPKKLNPIINLKEKQNAYTYHLINKNGSLSEVCISFLSKVLQISRKKVFRAVSSGKNNPGAIELRGSGKRRVLCPSDIQYLRKFIEKCVSYESCYNASQSSSKYLHPRLNFRRLFQLYRSECVWEQRTKISQGAFKRIFKTEYNLKFVRRTKPKCSLCRMSNQGLFVRSIACASQEKVRLDDHIATVEKANNVLFSLVDIAHLPTESIEIFTFEMQKSIELPCIDILHSFTKRQFWFHWLCVHDEVRNNTYYYVWNESIAGREAEETASCLYKHFLKHVSKTIKKIHLFSDPYSEDTRNMKMTLMLRKYLDYVSTSELSSIEQHFFVKGHSFNSCNRASDIIRRKIKPGEIFTPEQLSALISQQQLGGKKFIVQEMTQRDFYSCKPLINLLISDKNQEWSKFQKIIYNRENPFSLNVSEDTGHDSLPTNILLDTCSESCAPDMFNLTKLIYLNTEPLSISKRKYDDLQALMKTVPDEHHALYRSLKFSETTPVEDYALAEQST